MNMPPANPQPAMSRTVTKLAKLLALTLLMLAYLAAESICFGSSTANCPAACAPTTCSPALRPQDQVWLVSNRSIGCGSVSQAEKLGYWRYDQESGWVRADLQQLLATEADNQVTTVFVHGNRIGWSEAFTKGWSAYRALVRGADERPIRFIIWSWPSDAIRGPINDARIKAQRTTPSGQHLALFLDQLPPEAPISLWAHSFGARIVTGALHLLGGGNLGGYHLAERQHAERNPMQVVLLAAALDNTWLLPGSFHGQAMSQTSGLLLVNNSCDALLKRYRLLYHRRACQQALGYTGMPGGLPTDDWNRIDQIDACCAVGRGHAFDSYLTAPGLLPQMRNTLLTAVTDVSPATETTPAAPAEPAATEANPAETKTSETTEDEIPTLELEDAATSDTAPSDTEEMESAESEFVTAAQ